MWLSFGLCGPGSAGRERLKRGVPGSIWRCPPDPTINVEVRSEHVGCGDRDGPAQAIGNDRGDGHDKTVLDGGRFGTDVAGYRAMLVFARRFPQRTWAIEGCQGIGRHLAQRLISDGEPVVDVPPKLSARRVFATGQGRKTDATDAHSVALVGTRMTGLRPVVNDEQLTMLRLLVDRQPEMP